MSIRFSVSYLCFLNPSLMKLISVQCAKKKKLSHNFRSFLIIYKYHSETWKCASPTKIWQHLHLSRKIQANEIIFFICRWNWILVTIQQPMNWQLLYFKCIDTFSCSISRNCWMILFIICTTIYSDVYSVNKKHNLKLESKNSILVVLGTVYRNISYISKIYINTLSDTHTTAAWIVCAIVMSDDVERTIWQMRRKECALANGHTHISRTEIEKKDGKKRKKTNGIS